jgi:hypothetical protein
MPANVRETVIGFGKKHQSALATPNTAAGLWRLNKLNNNFGGPKLVTETDAAELGKGNEFPANVYKSHWEVAGQIEKYLSAEFAAWSMVYGLGKSVKAGGPNYIYTCTPLDPITDGIDQLPAFSFAEQIRPGPFALLDRVSIGCVINDWTLTVTRGPGRANSKLVVNFVGTGRHSNPSLIVIPAATAENLLASASLALTLNTVDYVTAKTIEGLTLSWNNNIRLDGRFCPGSGFHGSGTQVEVISLGGTSGSASITVAGGLTKTLTFATNPTLSASGFVTSFAADYAGAGIALTSTGPYLIFTDAVPGTGIAAPVITNVTGNLAGKIYHSQKNGGAGASGAVGNRMEFGDRTLSLKFTARIEANSTELNQVEDQTEGTAVIGLTYDANNSLQLTVQRVRIASADLDDAEGLVTVTGDCLALWHSANGLITAVAKCAVDAIGEADV